jgi:dynein heavy chain
VALASRSRVCRAPLAPCRRCARHRRAPCRPPLQAAAFNRAGNEPHIVKAFEDVAEEWCVETEKLLAESDAVRAESDDAGPETELEYWRTRMAKFNAITEQLRGRECKVVLGVLLAAKSRVLKRWKLLDNSITDANNEAKDNVKYLSTLEKYIEPLRIGTPETVLDALPGLLNNIKMMHTIARYYNTSERMTTLFRKITNKMIWNCKQYVNGPDPNIKLWDQDVPKLIQRLHACLALNELYQENYYTTRDKLLTQPKGKQVTSGGAHDCPAPL